MTDDSVPPSGRVSSQVPSYDLVSSAITTETMTLPILNDFLLRQTPQLQSSKSPTPQRAAHRFRHFALAINVMVFDMTALIKIAPTYPVKTELCPPRLDEL